MSSTQAATASRQMSSHWTRVIQSIDSKTWGGYVLATLLGLALRYLTHLRYVGNIDEPASLLAIKRTAEIGYPQLPSGVLYLQGAVLSFAASPLTWAFAHDDLFSAARILNLLIAVLVIPLSMKLTINLTGSGHIGLLVGMLVATDPNLIIWSVAIRPYGMLTVEFLALVLLFCMLIEQGPKAHFILGKVVYWIPVLIALGTFTHVGIWLGFPALALVSIAIWGRSLLRENRAILIAGLVSLLPLAVFIVLGRYVGIGSGTAGGNAGDSFVGSHLFSLRHMIESPSVRLDLWSDNFAAGTLRTLMPYAIALASCVLAFQLYRQPAKTDETQRKHNAMLAILAVHWLTILVVAIFVTTDFEPRYLTQVLPLGYVILGVSLWSILQLGVDQVETLSGHFLIRVTAIVLIVALVRNTTAAEWRIGNRGGSPDYWTVTKWVSANHQPDDVFITAQPPAAYFWFDDDAIRQTYFLAGPETSERTTRYIKQLANGSEGDYWLGVPPIASTAALCSLLKENNGHAWIILDTGKLFASWAFEGPMQLVISGTTSREFRAANGTSAYRVLPANEWSKRANVQCAVASKAEE